MREGGDRAPLAIVGATATGKTSVGLLVAEAIGAEIIGCDSRQVYRRLDVGSAKPTPAERARVTHHLVDVADPQERYSAARYRDAVRRLLPDLASRGRRALFVGGTGLYLRAATQGLCPAPPGDPALRRWLATVATTLPGGLHPLLTRVDAAAAARIHPNDRFRLTRALEVFYLSGRPLTELQEEHRASREGGPVRTFAIDLDGASIRGRIESRLREMMASGFLAEARGLFEDGLDGRLPALRAVGYPELFAHLRGETTLDAAVTAIRRATWQYARRQLTWFRAEASVEWIPAGGATPPEAIAGEILRRIRLPGSST